MVKMGSEWLTLPLRFSRALILIGASSRVEFPFVNATGFLPIVRGEEERGEQGRWKRRGRAGVLGRLRKRGQGIN